MFPEPVTALKKSDARETVTKIDISTSKGRYSSRADQKSATLEERLADSVLLTINQQKPNMHQKALAPLPMPRVVN